MRVAVVGSGVAGLSAARALAVAGVDVVLYERDSHIGGHACTVNFDGVDLDIGFMVFNQVTYPNMVAFYDEVGVEMEASDMSFAVSLAQGKSCEWGSSSLAGLFAQKRNMINPYFWNMIREIVKFKNDVLKFLKQVESTEVKIDFDLTLGEFLESHGYSQKFRECYLIPVCASVWSCSSESVLEFSAVSILTFCRNHHLLQLFGRPQWITVKGRSKNYVNKILEELKKANAEIRIATTVTDIKTLENGEIQVEDAKGLLDIFDKCIVAAHAPDALKMRGPNATQNEKLVLGAFQYAYSDIYLHRDKSYMPQNTAAWSAWNFLGDINGKVCVTYWLNLLQNLGDTGRPFLVTLNPSEEPVNVEKFWRTSHPIPSPSAANASEQLGSIQGHHGVWYCGAYQGYGFHEDGFKSGLKAANDVLQQKFEALGLAKQMVPTWLEFAAQQIVIAWLRKFVRIGNLRLLETGGSVFEFPGSEKEFSCALRIQTPAFYWKIATKAELGLAEAYIDGDFSFVGDTKNNLFHFMQLVTANRSAAAIESYPPKRGLQFTRPPKRGLQFTRFVTTSIGSAFSYAKPFLKSVWNASSNVAQGYDLNHEVASLFLDDTMTFSSGVFSKPDDTLHDAQLRKIHTFIRKARIEGSHEVLEIGFGWGGMAVEVVRLTGCRYTGITLSEEQLQFAQERVNEAGLQDRVTLLQCDYRKLPGIKKYHRIISCEVLETVGHGNYSGFFAKCDHLLAEDGVMVVQTTSIPDEKYGEHRRSPDFVKEYIFPGRSVPCLGALTAAMDARSTLAVQALENIGQHYVPTLMRWQQNFLANSSEIRRLGFNDKFIRMWDYYFNYCAAAFQSATVNNLQLVLSRPGNVSALKNPKFSFPTGSLLNS